MSPWKKVLVMFGATLSLILPTIVPLADALDIPGTVQIEALTCGLQFDETSVNIIDYGSLLPNEISAEFPMSFENTGNSDGDLFISGTDWKDASDVTQMLVGVTHFGLTSDYDAKLTLTSTPSNVGTVQPGTTYMYNFQIKALLENAGFSGAAAQAVTLSTEC